MENFFKFKNIKLDCNEFLFVQIIQRKKENPELGSNNRLIKSYCIKDYNDLIKHKKEIINLCNIFNARAYIHYTPRNIEQVTLQILSDITYRVCNKVYDTYPNRYFNMACGNTYVKEKRSWIVDIDCKNRRLVNDILRFIEEKCNPKGNKYIDLFETKNGFHLITKPFDLKFFKDNYKDIDVHKNNPTLLYWSNK